MANSATLGYAVPMRTVVTIIAAFSITACTSKPDKFEEAEAMLKVAEGARKNCIEAKDAEATLNALNGRKTKDVSKEICALADQIEQAADRAVAATK